MNDEQQKALLEIKKEIHDVNPYWSRYLKLKAWEKARDSFKNNQSFDEEDPLLISGEAFLWMAENNQSNMLEALIKKTQQKNKINEDSPEGEALLMKAFQYVNDGGETVLMKAAWVGSVEMTKTLLDAGAGVTINEQNAKGLTALMRAIWSGNLEVVDLILKAGAHGHLQDKNKWTALKWAGVLKRREVIRRLIQEGVDLNVQDDRGETVLMLLSRIQGETLEMIQMLVQAGARVDLKDCDQKTALDLAREHQKKEVEDYLMALQTHEGLKNTLTQSRSEDEETGKVKHL